MDLRRALLTSLSAVAALAAFACGSSPAQPPKAEPPVVTKPDAPPGTDGSGAIIIEAKPLSAKERLAKLDLEGARQVLADIEAHWPLRADRPFAESKSIEDVEQILKTDQVTLFPRAVAFLAQNDSVDGQALQGQIELAWGESYMLLAEVCVRLRDAILAKLATPPAAGPEEGARREAMYSSADELELRLESLKLVAIEHLAAGLTLAEKVIEAKPDNYLGYRVAADYYRILRAWDGFKEMVAKIQKLNPKSNGLLFLQGAAAFQVDRDRAKAEKLYHQALQNDPHFVRAQAHLLIIQDQLERTYEELVALEKLNPDHQLVVVAGEAIRKAYADWKTAQTSRN